jgi:hypothetical protein
VNVRQFSFSQVKFPFLLLLLLFFLPEEEKYI